MPTATNTLKTNQQQQEELSGQYKISNSRQKIHIAKIETKPLEKMSPMLTATLQTVFLNVLSNILAQLLQAYQKNVPLSLNTTPLINFGIFALLSTPPNILWQEWLESAFPSQVPVPEEKDPKKKKLSVANTAKKFLLDQSVGGPINTVLFIAGMAGLRGLPREEIIATVQTDFWPLVIASLKLWPAVAIISFTLIPVERRTVFGAMVALGWNVYIGLVMNMS